MDDKYCDIGLWEDKVIEESSELITELSTLIKAIIKAKRFGPTNSNLHKPEIKNKEQILLEILDLRYGLNAYEKELKGENNGM